MRTPNCSAHAAATVLRAERVGLPALAAHADRSLRTLAARQCAAAAFELARQGRALQSRPAWVQVDRRSYQFQFGGRRSVLTVPNEVTPVELAAMIARMEIRILLGDAGPELVTHLQAYAAREIERLFAAA
jgi:hypothetical protein